MKFLYKLHILTAITGWLVTIVGSFLVLLPEGSLVAFASLCMMTVVTVITTIDIFSVFTGKINIPPILLFLSGIFWVLFFGICIKSLLDSDVPVEGRLVFAGLMFIAIFKIYVLAVLFDEWQRYR